MKIYLIRHSITAGNKRRAYIGSTNEELCEEGVELLKQRTYPEVQLVVTSPMKRCIQTAQCIYPNKKPYVIDKLRECDFGAFEGLTYEELKENEVYQEWISKEGKIPFPGGEDQMEFRERCVDGFNEAVTYFYNRTISSGAMVVHGGTIMAILEAYARPREEFYYWKVENGEGYMVEVDEKAWFEKEVLQGNRYVTVRGKL
ncbi:histidine phosphatase family protein [Anaerosporobacter sp.]